MAEKTMNTRLKIRGDTASNWSSVNPTLLKNEIGYDETNKKFKIGDGTTPWNSLSYSNIAPSNSGVYYVEGTGTTAGTWTGSNTEITSYYDGLIVAYKLNISGASTTTLNINGLGAKTIYLRSNTKLTTQYDVNTVILAVYTTVSGEGRWYVNDYYEQNSFMVRQFNTTFYEEYPILLASDTKLPSNYDVASTRKNSKITANPGLGTITATKFNGTATKAVADENGNNIADTYALKSEVSEKITYNELKILRDSGQLVPGKQYQIIDYQCTTTQSNTKSAGHQFDIIVTADSESILNESARATYHDGDKYFGKPSIKNLSGENLYDTSGCSFIGAEEDLNITVFGYQYEFDDVNIDDIVDNYPEGEIQGDSGTDVFIAVDYKVNPHGFNSPIIYKTDEDYLEEADYGDEFWYVGKYDIDGITYDRWLKKELDDVENKYNFTDGIVRKYVLTNEIVDNDVTLIKSSSVNMNAWELKYCLDNDNSRFVWADITETGRGVIYYMKDEYGNECPYDFKNIMFERIKNGISDTRLLYGDRYIHSVANSIVWSHESSFGPSNEESDLKYFYTFSNYNSDDETVTDLTVSPFTLLEGESGLGAYGSKEILKTENNKIEKTTVSTTTDSNVAEKVQSLNDIVFVLHSSIMVSVIPKNNFWIKLFRNNIIKENCSGITIYDFAIDNTIDYGNSNIVIGFFSNNNKLGVGNENIGIFGSDNNTIDGSCIEVFINTHTYDAGTDGTKLNLINNIKFMNNCNNITLYEENSVNFKNVTILANSHDYWGIPMNVSIDSKFYLEDDDSPLSEYYTEE